MMLLQSDQGFACSWGGGSTYTMAYVWGDDYAVAEQNDHAGERAVSTLSSEVETFT